MKKSKIVKIGLLTLSISSGFIKSDELNASNSLLIPVGEQTITQNPVQKDTSVHNRMTPVAGSSRYISRTSRAYSKVRNVVRGGFGHSSGSATS